MIFAPSLLLGPEVVVQQPLERPDPAQQLQFGGGVVAVVTDGLANCVALPLLDMGAVALLPDRNIALVLDQIDFHEPGWQIAQVGTVRPAIWYCDSGEVVLPLVGSSRLEV